MKLQINKQLLNEIINENFEKGFELIENEYGKNYWRKGHTSLNAQKWGCDGAGIDKEECYDSKRKVLEVIKEELTDHIRTISNGDWELDSNESYDADLIKVLASLLIVK